MTMRMAKAGLQHMGCKVNILISAALFPLTEIYDLNCFFFWVH